MSKKMSAARKKEWKDPEIRERRRAAISRATKDRYRSAAERKKTSEAYKRAYAKYKKDPDKRRLYSERGRANGAKRKPEHGMSNEPEYKVWSAMIQRCTSKSYAQYRDYGGRGISVCSEWTGRGGFKRFIDHIGRRPSPKHLLGRIDNDGNYEPGNVRWETRREQMQNFRLNNNVTINGTTLCLTEWARRIGISAPGLAHRIKAGWADDELLLPSGAGRK